MASDQSNGQAGRDIEIAGPGQRLAQAIELHQRGDLQRAEALYRAVLAIDPRQPDAHHNLAIVRLQSGASPRDVLPHFRAAWEDHPEQPQYGVSLLRALMLCGLEAEADEVHAAARQRGISLPSPSVFRPSPGAKESPQPTRTSPATEAAFQNALASGNFATLRQLAEQVIAAAPGAASAWKHLALAIEGTGDPSNALVHARRATQLDPADRDTLLLAARLAQASGLPVEAIRAYQLALSRWPNDAGCWNALAQCHLAAHQPAEAEAATRKALSIDATLAAAWACRGRALLGLGQSGPAEECFDKALSLDIDSADAFQALGQALMASGRKAAAEQLCRRVLAQRPQHGDATYTLGTLQLEGGRLQEARDTLRKVADLYPARLGVRSTLLFIDNYLEDPPAAERLQEAIRYGRDAVRQAQGAALPAWRGEKAPARLRVGLVSPDLRTHPVGYFIEGLLASPASKTVDWIAYSSAPYTDETTGRLRSHFADWRNVNGLSDADCARLIRADGPHVLLDLAGHTLFNRLPVFAWKPAPVQVSWLGYFATTGLSAMDYLIADADCLPESLEGQFVERIWRLPTRLCFTPPVDAPAVRPPPSLSGAPVVFGCFQAHPKITDAMLSQWSRILAGVPGATLRFQNSQLGFEEERRALQHRLASAGIDPARIHLAGAVPRNHYLEDVGSVDIVLDTHPYPGGTTTCEALWMGVPTVTLAGSTLLSRQGASILRAAGLADWVAGSPAEYVDLAIHKAGDVGGLAALRQDARARLPRTPLFDTDRFASELVAALRAMWERAEHPAPPRA